MKLKQSVLATFLLGASIGPAINFATAQERPSNHPSSPTDRYPSKAEDDSTLAPGVPGVTEQNNAGMSRENIIKIETALQAKGHNPGKVDGVMDNETRAAIREFQKKNDLRVTGSVDEKTGRLLGINLEASGASGQSPRGSAR